MNSDNGNPKVEQKDDAEASDDVRAEALQQVLGKLTDICDRLSSLEVEREQKAGAGATPSQGGTPQKNVFESNYETFLAASPLLQEAQVLGEDRELSVNFQALKDATKNIVLPSDLVLSEGWFPSPKSDARRMMGLLRKSYGYISTQLKLLKKLSDERDLSPAATKLLYTALAAHAKGLQYESNVCFLEGAASYKDPMTFYKALNGNKNLTQHDKETYKLSAELFVASRVGPETGSGAAVGAGGKDKPKKKPWNNSGNSAGARPKSTYYNSSRDKDRQDHKDPFESAVNSLSGQKP